MPVHISYVVDVGGSSQGAGMAGAGGETAYPVRKALGCTTGQWERVRAFRLEHRFGDRGRNRAPPARPRPGGRGPGPAAGPGGAAGGADEPRDGAAFPGQGRPRETHQP